MNVTDDLGRELNAGFAIERTPRGVDLIVASRGGAGKGTPAGRNIDYEKGIEILLGRLAHWRVGLDGVSVDSALAQRRPPGARRLTTSGYAFPLDLAAVADIRALRLDIR